MSNPCIQRLVVTGEKDDLAPFVEKILQFTKFSENDPSKEYYELNYTFYQYPDFFSSNEFENENNLSLRDFKEFNENLDHIPDFSKIDIVSLWKSFKGDENNKMSFKYFYYILEKLYQEMQVWEPMSQVLDLDLVEVDDTHIQFIYLTKYVPFERFIFDFSEEYPNLTFILDYSDGMVNCPDEGMKIKNGEVLCQWVESKEDYQKRVAAFCGEPPLE